ncbi:MAG: DUF2807 domain-containing protein [Sphingomonas bacterium]|nr:DUF2807 domain-containing protein [Sphingomonas bacterium]
MKSPARFALSIAATIAVAAISTMAPGSAAFADAQTDTRTGERHVYIGSFDRIRVQGPFAVRVIEGSPDAILSGDPRIIESVEVRVDGTTLTVRNAMGAWGERPRATATRPVIVTLRTRSVANALVIGGGKLSLARMKATRVDLSVTGAGAIEARGIEADQASATIIGGGAIMMAGTARTARLLTNGPAAIDASALSAGDLTVRVDGPGAVKAAARFTARVDNIGLGQVEISGKPKCTVKADVGGAVSCGAE